MIDMNDLMKKAQELSQNMQKQQEELAQLTFDAVSYTHLTLPTTYSV